MRPHAAIGKEAPVDGINKLLRCFSVWDRSQHPTSSWEVLTPGKRWNVVFLESMFTRFLGQDTVH